MTDVLDVGTTTQIDCTFKVDNVNTDPDAVTAKIRHEDTAVADADEYVYGVNAELTKVATGIYRLTYLVDTAGDYFVEFEGTGAAAGVKIFQFEVRESEFRS